MSDGYYDEEYNSRVLEDDEISAFEAAFMDGYNRAEVQSS